MINRPTFADPPEELARLREDLVAFYHPANSQERVAVEHIALAQQSMQRAARLESSLFANPPGADLHSVLETQAFTVFLRYQAQAERAYRRALEELRSLQRQRSGVPVVPEPKPQLVASASSALAAAPAANPAARASAPSVGRAAAVHGAAGNLALRL